MDDPVSFARRLRREQTPAERRFWTLLHPFRTGGWHWRRQAPIGPYVVDFVCKRARFSVFKRGMIGTYQHCGEAHLHRYLAEFDFRYNRRTALKVSDVERTNQLLAMIEGKRLTYRRIGEASYA